MNDYMKALHQRFFWELERPSCCFANKLRKFFKQSAKKKRRLKGF